jgi:MinD-like ATPase involved in chromosome partitioning or flagellar assembly
MSRERLVLAFGGGKGGVGKSLVCSAVATALAQRGLSVVALDADLGAANLHTLLGLVHPSATLDDFFTGRVARARRDLSSDGHRRSASHQRRGGHPPGRQSPPART